MEQCHSQMCIRDSIDAFLDEAVEEACPRT